VNRLIQGFRYSPNRRIVIGTIALAACATIVLLFSYPGLFHKRALSNYAATALAFADSFVSAFARIFARRRAIRWVEAM